MDHDISNAALWIQAFTGYLPDWPRWIDGPLTAAAIVVAVSPWIVRLTKYLRRLGKSRPTASAAEGPDPETKKIGARRTLEEGEFVVERSGEGFNVSRVIGLGYTKRLGYVRSYKEAEDLMDRHRRDGEVVYTGK